MQGSSLILHRNPEGITRHSIEFFNGSRKSQFIWKPQNFLNGTRIENFQRVPKIVEGHTISIGTLCK